MVALVSRTQSVIRRVHVELLSRQLPVQIAVYVHEIEREMWPAFREMVEYLRSLDYRFVGPDAFLEAGERAVFLSFDDNYRSWYEALPFFAELGVSATFYVNTCVFRDRASPAEIDAYFDRLHFHGERVPLSVAELRGIALSGHVVGAHGHSHRCLGDPARRRSARRHRLVQTAARGSAGTGGRALFLSLRHAAPFQRGSSRLLPEYWLSDRRQRHSRHAVRPTKGGRDPAVDLAFECPDGGQSREPVRRRQVVRAPDRAKRARLSAWLSPASRRRTGRAALPTGKL